MSTHTHTHLKFSIPFIFERRKKSNQFVMIGLCIACYRLKFNDSCPFNSILCMLIISHLKTIQLHENLRTRNEVTLTGNVKKNGKSIESTMIFGFCVCVALRVRIQDTQFTRHNTNEMDKNCISHQPKFVYI